MSDLRGSARIENLELCSGIARKCGYKVRYVTSPDAEEKQEVVSNCCVFTKTLKEKYLIELG